MKKVSTLLSILFLLLSITEYAQTSSTQGNNSGKNQKKKMTVKWTKNPFDNQVFIENNGQFDGIINGGQKVYYAVRLGDVQAFFTANGIVYQLKKYPKLDMSKGQDPDAGGPPKPIIKYVSSEWKGSNINTQREGNDKQLFYYTYPSGSNGTIKTSVFKRITYRNLYPGVDVEYSFKSGKPGIEYKLIVHPGADISKVNLLYNKGVSKSTISSKGEIEAKTNMGLFTMSAPEGYYPDNNEHLKVSYLLNGNEETFSVVNPKPSKTYIIDPWVTDPLFTTDDRAYDLDYDNHGNVYVYGGDASPYQLIKLNSTGVIQWVFNATTLTSSTNYYGDLAVDKVTSESYLVEGWNAGGGGARAEKVNTLGVLMATFPGNPQLGEMYRIEYDACNRDVVVGGGGTSQPYQACVLDTSMVTIVPVNVESVGTGYHDMALLAIDPQGTTCYMGTTQSLVYTTIENNYLVKLPLPTLSPSILNLNDGLSFHEIGSVHYTYGTDNGFNGMAASPNWLYLYSGDTLRQLNKSTGALNKMLPLNIHLYNYHWGGLDVDACDDIYIGYRDSIKIYNSTLAPEDSLALPAATDTIYDLHLGQNNLMYACGIGFVCAINVPSPPTLISSAVGTPSSCSACNGTATVNVNCGVAPYAFTWSNGNTNETDTGLCAGIYTVTVTDAACPPHTDSATVSVSGEVGFSASITDTNPDCGLKKGNATVHVIGGHPPYTYAWSNGSTNQEDTGLVAGGYNCIITDNSGCRYLISVTLVNPTAPLIKVIPALDSLCLGSSVVLTASGAGGSGTYSWTPSIGLSCNNCPTPTATPTVTTTYTVTGTDSIGCTGTATAKIKVYVTPKPIITGKDSVCSGYTDTLSVTGGTTYLWSTGATTSSIDNVTVITQVITVTAHNGMCSHDTSFTIHVVSPAALITAVPDSVCTGDSVNLTGSGGTTYKWNTGKTTSSIWVNPSSTTTYTLYVHSGTCNDSTTKSVRVIPGITATISAINDTVCPHGTTTITATGIGGQATYKWNNGATTGTINVTDTVTTTYTATVYGLCDSTKVMKTVVVVPLPIPVISGRTWECHGTKDTLTVSSSFNPTSYLWSNGSTKTSYNITGPINADSMIYVTAENSLGCPVKDSFKITVRIAPTVSVNPSTVSCGGQPVVLKAKATGTNAPFTYTWLPAGTGSGDSVTVNPDSAESYTVIVSNGCNTTRVTTVTPVSPSIGACCNTTIVKGNDTILVASGDTSIVSYSWTPSVDCLNPLCDSVKVKPGVTTTYTVTGTDSKGCQSERIVTITVEIPCFNFTVPNVFTPSNAGALGLDNVFYINTSSSNVDSWSIIIYDRWGKEMFKSTNPNEYWNGNAEGGGQAPAGVYYYIIDGTCQGNTYKKDGFVQLIR